MTEAKKLLTAAKQKDVLAERISLLNMDISLFTYRIGIKDSIISELRLKEENSEAIIRAQEDQKATMLEQRKILEDQVRTYETLLRKEKRKRFWTAAAGIAASGIATFFYITK